MSQHELFDVVTRDGPSNQDKSRITRLKQSLKAAEDLGLSAQVQTISAEISTISHNVATPPMSEDEIAIWRAFLPTAYTEAHRNVANTIAKYSFDRIPGNVLDAWAKHRKAGSFERYEIWTAERSAPVVYDPILIGVNGNAHFLLARWGESDANLVSFDDIKREVVRRIRKGWRVTGSDSRERAINLEYIPILTGIVTFMLFAFFAPIDRAGGVSEMAALLLIACAAAVGATAHSAVKFVIKRRVLESDPLVQAIRRHDALETA